MEITIYYATFDVYENKQETLRKERNLIILLLYKFDCACILLGNNVVLLDCLKMLNNILIY